MTECHESQVQKSELVKITKYAATRISDIGFQNIHDYEQMYNLTLKEAYDTWIASGRAEEVDKHKDNYLGWIQANL